MSPFSVLMIQLRGAVHLTSEDSLDVAFHTSPVMHPNPPKTGVESGGEVYPNPYGRNDLIVLMLTLN